MSAPWKIGRAKNGRSPVSDRATGEEIGCVLVPAAPGPKEWLSFRLGEPGRPGEHVASETRRGWAAEVLWRSWRRSRLNGLLDAEEAEALREFMSWAADHYAAEMDIGDDTWYRNPARLAVARKVFDLLEGS